MIDTYTKTILTVIAFALIASVGQNFTGSLQAQSRDIQKVQICDSQGCASLVPRFTKTGSMGITGYSLATSNE